MGWAGELEGEVVSPQCPPCSKGAWVNLRAPPQAPLAGLADLGSLAGEGHGSRGTSSEQETPRVVAAELNLCPNATQGRLPPGNQKGGRQRVGGGEAGRGG